MVSCFCSVVSVVRYLISFIILCLIAWFCSGIYGVGYRSYCGCEGHERMVCCCLDKECSCVLCRTR